MLVLVALMLSFLLVVWLRTNAFVEYMRLFRLGGLFHVDEYAKISADGYEGNYIDFLVEYYKDSFFVRLLSCAVCISSWTGIGGFLFTLHWVGLLLAPLTLLFYLIFSKLLG